MLKRLLLYGMLWTSFLAASTEVRALEQTDKAIAGNLTVLFSPNDKITDKLIPLIDGASKSIYAAVYMLTDKKIADALIRAKQRGVTIQLILDPISTGKYGKADYLVGNGIAIYIYQAPPNARPWFSPIMHNKFACIDNKILWTGSFNWTVSANITNEENVTISKDPAVCTVFRTYFDTLLKTKTTSFVLARQQLNPETTLREIVTRALASTTTDESLYEILALTLQENSARWSAIQTVH